MAALSDSWLAAAAGSGDDDLELQPRASLPVAIATAAAAFTAVLPLMPPLRPPALLAATPLPPGARGQRTGSWWARQTSMAGVMGPLYPFFLKKRVQRVQAVQYPVYPLFRSVSYIPLYRLPLPAPSGGPPCAAAFGRPSFYFRPDARGAGQTHLATDSGPAETHASAPCTAPLAGFRR